MKRNSNDLVIACRAQKQEVVVEEYLPAFPAMKAEESLILLLKKEEEFLLSADYLTRLKSERGDLHSSLEIRSKAIDWIVKADAQKGFGPQCVSVALNYFNRVISVSDVPEYKSVNMVVLAMSCYLLATKLEYDVLYKVPRYDKLNIGVLFDGVINAKVLLQAEVFVLDVLNYRMHAITPYSFIDHFLFNDKADELRLNVRIQTLIASTLQVIDFLEFRPSVIAAAAVISVSGGIQAISVNKAVSAFKYLKWGSVVKCYELFNTLSLRGSANVANALPPLYINYTPD